MYRNRKDSGEVEWVHQTQGGRVKANRWAFLENVCVLMSLGGGVFVG